MKWKLAGLVLVSIPIYSALAWFSLSVLHVGTVTFGMVTVAFVSAYVFWLGRKAKGYVETPGALTAEERAEADRVIAEVQERARKRKNL